jgi:ubiquinone/menaquinone biosynthesis C-methylase UbiE
MYTKHARQYASAVEDNIYNALLERPSTKKLVGDVKGLDVIDMGCGSGIYANWLIEQSASRLTCVDASPQMVALVAERYGHRVNAYVQDISLGLPNEPDASADVIICPLVLHYIEELAPVFAEVQRVLKPGGCMVFSTHHPFADFDASLTGNYFERERITQQWDTVGTPVTVQFYRRSLTEIAQSITASGLSITAIREGEVNEKAKQISNTTYQHLTTHPNFIFFRCEKAK